MTLGDWQFFFCGPSLSRVFLSRLSGVSCVFFGWCVYLLVWMAESLPICSNSSDSISLSVPSTSTLTGAVSPDPVSLPVSSGRFYPGVAFVSVPPVSV